MESDLSQYHGLDYRDRWRFDSQGRRKLTLRMIYVRVHHLRPDSATALAVGGSGWTLGDFLLADIFHATAHEPSLRLPKQVKGSDPARDKRVREAKARAAERQRAIAAGEIT